MKAKNNSKSPAPTTMNEGENGNQYIKISKNKGTTIREGNKTYIGNLATIDHIN